MCVWLAGGGMVPDHQRPWMAAVERPMDGLEACPEPFPRPLICAEFTKKGSEVYHDRQHPDGAGHHLRRRQIHFGCCAVPALLPAGYQGCAVQTPEHG